MKPESPDPRFAAHRALPAIGAAGQARIAQARIVLVGLGGLGCAAAQYLASSGAGRLTLCDFDRVERSNLARQVLYGPADVGRRKTAAAADRLAALNPDVHLDTLEQRVDAEAARQLLLQHDLAIDASDNYGTRLAINQASLATGRPWVMGSCIRLEGQFAFFPGRGEAPCYRCIYGQAPETLEDCPGAGIFAPVAGVVGAAMAHAALLCVAGAPLAPGLQLLDAAGWNWRTVKARRQPNCPACGGQSGT